MTQPDIGPAPRPDPTLRIAPAQLPADLGHVRALFTAYAQGLGVDLHFQGFEAELASLPGKYAAPMGSILLAWQGDQPVGCIAMRPLGDGICEMKRLYVAPAGRGLGLGRVLSDALIRTARQAGHRRMVLDTLDRLVPAIRLYDSMGFRSIAPYYDNPLPGVVYMGRDL